MEASGKLVVETFPPIPSEGLVFCTVASFVPILGILFSSVPSSHAFYSSPV